MDALLGEQKQREHSEKIAFDSNAVDHDEFANVNGIKYTLESFLGDKSHQRQSADTEPHEAAQQDKDIIDEASDIFKVASEVAFSHGNGEVLAPGNRLHFMVVYLAPGDYHRFHSPANWVVETRRHFAGELFSVSPFIAKRIADLFVLNERIVLLGRWRYGFFSMIPVGMFS